LAGARRGPEQRRGIAFPDLGARQQGLRLTEERIGAGPEIVEYKGIHHFERGKGLFKCDFPEKARNDLLRISDIGRMSWPIKKWGIR
jgi:hypothetical protein